MVPVRGADGQFEPTRDGPALIACSPGLRPPGIARVIRGGDFAALGFPDYNDNPYALGHVIVAAGADTHLVIDAKSTSTARRKKAAVYHGHGYLPTHPSMRPALVLSGAGIVKGTRLGQVRNVDVAPTIASLLGVTLSNVEGTGIR